MSIQELVFIFFAIVLLRLLNTRTGLLTVILSTLLFFVAILYLAQAISIGAFFDHQMLVLLLIVLGVLKLTLGALIWIYMRNFENKRGAH